MPPRQAKLGKTGETVSQKVKEMRGIRRFTLRDLSEKMAEIGHPLSAATLSEIERGVRRVDVDELAALADALDTDAYRLLGGGIVLEDDIGLSDEATEIIDLVTALDRRLFQAELASEPDEPDDGEVQ